MMKMERKQKPKFAMDFVGFASYGISHIEASIAVIPDFDLVGATSTLTDAEEGSRVITLIFRRSEKKLGRRGYSLKQEWKILPNKKTIRGKQTGEQK